MPLQSGIYLRGQIQRIRVKFRLYRPTAQAKRWKMLEAQGIVSVGRGTYEPGLIRIVGFHGGRDNRWLGSHLTIGNYCSIGDTMICLHEGHHTEWMTQFPFPAIWGLEGREFDAVNKGDVTIGNDVWIGAGSIILSGVTIGDGAVIGAHAVVTRDVRPYAVVVGNPGREVKRRFDDATVGRLLEMKWWNWPDEKIQSSLHLLLAPPS